MQAHPAESRADSGRPGLSAWRFVTIFGAVSLLADFVYEGARSITGPLLAWPACSRSGYRA